MSVTQIDQSQAVLNGIALPPAFALHVSPSRDVLAEAVRIAPEKGAGTLVVFADDRLLAFAVVLEPEQPLAAARQAFVLGMTALGDALAAHCPPERAVRLVWPDLVMFDTARLGGGRFAVIPDCAEDQVPDYLVFAAELIAGRDHLDEPGRFPDSTSLQEEAFDSGDQIVATFASYVMLYFDRWAHDGFDAVANRFLMRVDPPLLRGVRRLEGTSLMEITPSGGGKRYPPLAEALARQVWRSDDGPLL